MKRVLYFDECDITEKKYEDKDEDEETEEDRIQKEIDDFIFKHEKPIHVPSWVFEQLEHGEQLELEEEKEEDPLVKKRRLEQEQMFNDQQVELAITICTEEKSWSDLDLKRSAHKGNTHLPDHKTMQEELIKKVEEQRQVVERIEKANAACSANNVNQGATVKWTFESLQNSIATVRSQILDHDLYIRVKNKLEKNWCEYQKQNAKSIPENIKPIPKPKTHREINTPYYYKTTVRYWLGRVWGCKHNKVFDACRMCPDIKCDQCSHEKPRIKCKKCKKFGVCMHDTIQEYCSNCVGCTNRIIPPQPKRKAKTKPKSKTKEPPKPKAKTKEFYLHEWIQKEFPQAAFVHDKAIANVRHSLRRPDWRIDLDSHVLVIENDEDQHVEYSNEQNRMVEIYNAFGRKPLLFIRFNPDFYVDTEGLIHQGCFEKEINSNDLIMNKEEWKSRTFVLQKEIEKRLVEIPKKGMTIVYLFYSEFTNNE
jgi:hypothetical protein